MYKEFKINKIKINKISLFKVNLMKLELIHSKYTAKTQYLGLATTFSFVV